MNNAELIIATLANAGINTGFGVPSGNVLPLMEAMRQGQVAFALTAHEGSAAFAADVTGRLCGAPGLCIATLGPGATNLATGVGGAWLDRSPMIAITCNLPTAQLGRRIQMWIDHHALFAPITKASWRLETATVAEQVSAAVTLAMSEPPGPVHLDLPEDVALAPAQGGVRHPAPGTRAKPASAEAVATAMQQLAQAHHPIAVIGATAMRMAHPERLRAFIEHHQLPFATTTMAKGMIDESHPLAIGCIERAKRQLQRTFMRQADLITGLGYDTVEVEYEAWVEQIPVLHLDNDTADVDATVHLAGQAVGDLDDLLAQALGHRASVNRWTSETLNAHRAAFARALRPPSPGFSPHQAIDAVRQVLPGNGILAYDVGAHTHQIASQWRANAPGQCLITNGWSSMGFGLPAAIAAKLTHPERPVVALIGDGCFQMTCGELATLRRLSLNIPVVVLDDNWLSLIQIKQTRRQYRHYGTELLPGGGPPPPAHYFSVPAVAVTDEQSLKAALAAALASDSATVIEAQIDASHYMNTVFD